MIRNDGVRVFSVNTVWYVEFIGKWMCIDEHVTELNVAHVNWKKKNMREWIGKWVCINAHVAEYHCTVGWLKRMNGHVIVYQNACGWV